MNKLFSYLGMSVLILALILTLTPSAAAQSSQSGNFDFGTDKALIIAGVVVVAAAVIVTVVVIHKTSGKRTITGCVASSPTGLTLSSDSDKRLYSLSGGIAGLKPGERMTLHVKKIKPSDGSKSLTWEPLKIDKDLGACQP